MALFFLCSSRKLQTQGQKIKPETEVVSQAEQRNLVEGKQDVLE